VELTKVLPLHAEHGKFLSDKRDVHWVQLTRVLAHNQGTFEVPGHQITAIVNHLSVDLVDKEVEVLSVLEATIETFQSHDAGGFLLTMHDDVVPDRGTIYCSQVVDSLISDLLIEWELPCEELAFKAVVLIVEAVLHVPFS